MTARRGRTPSAKPATQASPTKARRAEKVKVQRVEPADEPKPPKQDVVLVTGPTDDGKGVNVLRAKNDTLQVGAVRPLEEGKPILGELVRLKQRSESPALFDVESQLPSPTPSTNAAKPKPRANTDARPTSAGPAQVATDTYRSGWDRIYKRSAKKNLPN